MRDWWSREYWFGSSFIKAVLRFEPASVVVVVDLNENGLAELVRDVRSTEGLYVPNEFRCYTLNFADGIEDNKVTLWGTERRRAQEEYERMLEEGRVNKGNVN